MIGHVPGNVHRISSRIFRNGDLSPKAFLTEQREFPQRDRSAAAAADVEGTSRDQIPGLELSPYKIAKIVRMKQIANLTPCLPNPMYFNGRPK